MDPEAVGDAISPVRETVNTSRNPNHDGEHMIDLF